MFHYQFNIGDYRAHTQHLTPTEHYIYRTLIDWYYLTEKPMKVDIKNIARKLLLRTDEEMDSLRLVLNEFFKIKNGAYHHARINQEIKNYHNPMKSNKGNEFNNDSGNATGNGKGNALSNAERVAKYKQEKKSMIKALISIGVNINKNIGMTELRGLYAEHFGNDISNDEHGNGNENGNTGNGHGNEGNESGNAQDTPETDAITINHKPLTNNHEPKENNNNKNARENFESIKSWEPNFDEIAKIMLTESPNMPPLTKTQFDSYLRRFKAHHVERESKGEFIQTDEMRLELLVGWIAKAQVYSAKAKQDTVNVATGEVDNTDWSKVGRKPEPSSDVSDVFHPSHKPTEPQAKSEPATSIYFVPPHMGGKTYPLFEGMTLMETQATVLENMKKGESQEDCYLRLISEMGEEV